MPISLKMDGFLSRSSWIRKMFEEGGRLKKEHGAENVFDFSLGNPNLPPPGRFEAVMAEVMDSAGPGDHAYMPNAGYPHVRAAVADYVSGEQGCEALTPDDVIMTCGAAGGLNVVFKAVLDPGDEIITPAPFFVEYNFYADNHGGRLVTIPAKDDFTLDLDSIAGAITQKTRAVLINSPNNPTGQVYSEESLMALGALLREKSQIHGRRIYLVSDEPYRKIVYDGLKVPGIFSSYEFSIVVNSYSKDISIPGERMGFIAVNPGINPRDKLLAAMTLANRILGFVNAPALMQRVIAELQGESVDISEYARKRELLCQGLGEIGYDFVKPRGAFYLFPRSPIADDVKFVRILQEEQILAVPGSGFGGPGHFRIAFCVDDMTITNAMPGFKRAMGKV